MPCTAIIKLLASYALCGIWNYVASKFGKSDKEKLGMLETDNATLVAENKKLKEQLQVANQGITPSQVAEDLRKGEF